MTSMVFGIGLSKTGTTSLSKALDALGYRCSHYPLGAMNYRRKSAWATYLLNALGYRMIKKPLGIYAYTLDAPPINLSGFTAYNAFADIPIAYCYQHLDKLYPESKFILTIRERSDWLRSCRFHVNRPTRPGRPKWWRDDEMGPWNDEMTNLINRLVYDVYGSMTFNAELFWAAYQRHYRQVLAYFSTRPDDLLVLDITKGEGWAPLCTFLNRPIPSTPFPIENVTKRKYLGNE